MAPCAIFGRPRAVPSKPLDRPDSRPVTLAFALLNQGYCPRPSPPTEGPGPDARPVRPGRLVAHMVGGAALPVAEDRHSRAAIAVGSRRPRIRIYFALQHDRCRGADAPIKAWSAWRNRWCPPGPPPLTMYNRAQRALLSFADGIEYT